jgi:DNA-binding transcriptional regulator LsrR (DeoR family)
MARVDELRLMAKVARLYYERGLKQTEIARQLDISQATISRLLKRAEDEQIVRINISVPLGAYPHLEDEIEAAYGVKEVIVVDCLMDDAQVLRDLGAAAAYYLETTLKPNEVIGISSWSSTLLAMVDAMHPVSKHMGVQVLQILGGSGSPDAAHHAVQLVRRLANLVQGSAHFLPAPGVTGSAEAQRAFLQDSYVREALDRFKNVTMALVGIGSVDPSQLLSLSGNVFSPKELDSLRAQGAVGDVCLRFFDQAGKPIETAFNDRVIGMHLSELRKVQRSVGIAGGKRKLEAIRGALLGGWINVLITDLETAKWLLERVPRDKNGERG